MPTPENIVWPPAPPSPLDSIHTDPSHHRQQSPPEPHRNMGCAPDTPPRLGVKFWWLAVSALVFLVAIAFASPYWKVYRLKGALLDLDANYISKSVDFEQLRANLKASNRAGILSREMWEEESPNWMIASAASSIGDSVIDGMVTPEGVAALMGEIRSSIDSSPPSSNASSVFRLNVEKWYELTRTGYASPNSFEVSFPYSERSEVTFIMSRHSLFWWELSDIRLPSE
jgi:hypothetical protein